MVELGSIHKGNKNLVYNVARKTARSLSGRRLRRW